MLAQNLLLTNINVNLLQCLKRSIRNSKKIKILAAFIMESGVRLILDDLIYYAGIIGNKFLCFLKNKKDWHDTGDREKIHNLYFQTSTRLEHQKN